MNKDKDYGYYVAIKHSTAKHKPSVARVGKKKLNMIDFTMRKGGYQEYDLGIMWSDVEWAWVLYAFVM